MAIERVHPEIDPARIQHRIGLMVDAFEDAMVDGWERYLHEVLGCRGRCRLVLAFPPVVVGAVPVVWESDVRFGTRTATGLEFIEAAAQRHSLATEGDA